MDKAHYMKQAIIETVLELDDKTLEKIYALVMIMANGEDQAKTSNAV